MKILFFEFFSALINTDLPSGLFEPLGLLFVAQLRLRRFLSWHACFCQTASHF
jgi:hypothetical protein